MSASPYEPVGAFLGSDLPPAAALHQTSTASQITVTNGTRHESRASTAHAREDDERIAGYTYNPSERIERMFGISPPWR